MFQNRWMTCALLLVLAAGPSEAPDMYSVQLHSMLLQAQMVLTVATLL